MNRISLVAGALLVVLSCVHDASAQGFINPFVGTTLTSPADLGSSTKMGYGAAFGGMGKVVGGEAELEYFPELIDNAANAIAKNNVFTLSADMLIGPTISGVKPYFAIGAGSLRLSLTGISSVLVPNPESLSNTYFTFNTGGGVIGFFSKHIGARGDLRYTRAVGFKLEDLETTGLAFDKFNYWRANFGLAIKF